MERPTDAIQIFLPESPALARPFRERDYYVTFDGLHWNVSTADGETGPSSFDRPMALALAIRAAGHDHADGMDVTVAVEEPDGSFTPAWASA